MSGEKPKGKISPSLIVAVIIIIILLAALVYYATLPPKVEVIPTIIPTTIVQTALKTETLPGTTIVRTEVKTIVQTLTPTPTMPTGPVEINLLYEPDMPWMIYAIELFEKLYPNIKINYIGCPIAELSKKITADMVSGEKYSMYDVVYNWGGMCQQFGAAGYWLDLSKNVTAEEIEKLVPGALDFLTYTRADGSKYLTGLPSFTDAQLFYYRTDLFEKAGLTRPPKNYEELIEYAKKLTMDINGDGKIDIYGWVEDWATDNIQFNFYTRLNAAGGKAWEEGKLIINSTEGIRAAEWMKKLWESGAVYPDTLNFYSSGQKMKVFYTGMAAMTWAWPFLSAYANDPKKSTIVGKWDVALMPGDILPSASVDGSEGFGIPSKARHPKEALLFIKFISFNEEFQLNFIKKYGYPAVLKKVYEDPEIKASKTWQIYIEQLKYPYSRHYSKYDPQIWDLMDLYLKKAIIGEMDIKEALDKICAEISKFAALG
ncbi:MAG: sugar ABC transporter substrate-binding protein [Candidatus Methanomethylicia archaeon]